MGRKLHGSASGFPGLGIATISAPDLWNFELAHAGKPGLEGRPGVEYKFWEDAIQPRRLSWLQAAEGSSKPSGLKGSDIL